MRSIAILFALSLVASLSGCMRHGAAGESCEAPGLQDRAAIGQCADGFVCTPDRSGLDGNGQSPHWNTSTCRSTCASDVDCTEPHTSCRVVAGSEYVMACQPN